MPSLKELRKGLGIQKRTDTKPQTVSVGIKLPVELAKRVLKQVDKEQVSMSTLIAKALTKYMEELK